MSARSRMNSIMEWWVQTCRHELLDRTLIWNQQHLLHAPAASPVINSPEPLATGDAEFANEEDVERSAEGRRELVPDRHAAAGQRQHQDVRAVPVPLEQVC
jgi:hypothetical protein